jgi:hypothetical protein
MDMRHEVLIADRCDVGYQTWFGLASRSSSPRTLKADIGPLEFKICLVFFVLSFAIAKLGREIFIAPREFCSVALPLISELTMTNRPQSERSLLQL